MMKKIIDFIVKHHQNILLFIVISVAIIVVILPFAIFMGRMCWELALNAPIILE